MPSKALKYDICTTSNGGRSVFGVGQEDEDNSFPFVNRCADALDLFAPQMIFHGAQLSVSLAYQFMGSGKTSLGLNAVGVLRRPRESNAAEEERVAECLMNSVTLTRLPFTKRERIIAKARARPEDETLVARVLRQYLFEQVSDPTLVDAAKNASTVYINIGDHEVESHTSMSSFISHAIFRAMGLSNPPSSASAACIAVSRFLGGRAVLLVIDEIGKLVAEEYRALLPREMGDLGTATMHALRAVIEIIRRSLKNDSRWMIYLAGRTDWLAMHAPAGPMSPLRAKPVLLAPLRGQDVLEMIRHAPRFQTLIWSSGVMEQVAMEIARRSGGVGRVINAALHVLVHLDNFDNIDELMDYVEGKVLSEADTLFPRAALNPADTCDPSLLTSIGRLVLSGAPFEEKAEVPFGENRSVLVTSALTALGFNFVPAPNDGDDSRPELVPAAGSWHILTLPNVLLNAAGADALRLLRLLHWTEKDASRGPPFDCLCIVQTMQLLRDQIPPGERRSLCDLIPFLRGTSAETATVSRLRLRLMPKFSSANKKPLTDIEKHN